MKSLTALFSLVWMLFGPQAFAVSYQNCSDDQVLALQNAEALAKETGAILLQDLSAAAEDLNRTSRDSKNDRKLKHAADQIECAMSYMGKLNYECVQGKKAYGARTYWIFAKQITIPEDFYDRKDSFRAGTLLHEFTHKCGTTDAAYFTTTPPHDTFWVNWSKIADTYEFWVDYGFCIPGETCVYNPEQAKDWLTQ